MNDDVMRRIAEALERLAPPPPSQPEPEGADAFVYDAHAHALTPVPEVQRVEIDLLQGIDHVARILLANTERFARGLPANNALLWGARGMGKSSLVKAAHARVNAERPGALALIEVHREDIEALPRLLTALAQSERRCLLFCDDLSFDAGETSYKSLKAVLEGGLQGRPKNVLFYATSNRRHLMPRNISENEREQALHPGEAVEEKVSLSDRFGLWLGFHGCDQATYLRMVDGYVEHHGLEVAPDELKRRALEWAATRGHRSGRVAHQFVQDLAGEMGKEL